MKVEKRLWQALFEMSQGKRSLDCLLRALKELEPVLEDVPLLDQTWLTPCKQRKQPFRRYLADADVQVAVTANDPQAPIITDSPMEETPPRLQDEREGGRDGNHERQADKNLDGGGNQPPAADDMEVDEGADGDAGGGMGIEAGGDQESGGRMDMDGGGDEEPSGGMHVDDEIHRTGLNLRKRSRSTAAADPSSAKRPAGHVATVTKRRRKTLKAKPRKSSSHINTDDEADEAASIWLQTKEPVVSGVYPIAVDLNKTPEGEVRAT